MTGMPHQKDDLKTLAKRLRKARRDFGDRRGRPMTQGELAGLVGCSRQFLNNLETGHSKELGADLAICIADALNVSIHWLVRGDPLRGYYKLTNEEEAGLLAFRSLSPALQKHFLDSVKALSAIQPTPDNPFPLAPKPKHPV